MLTKVSVCQLSGEYWVHIILIIFVLFSLFKFLFTWRSKLKNVFRQYCSLVYQPGSVSILDQNTKFYFSSALKTGFAFLFVNFQLDAASYSTPEPNSHFPMHLIQSFCKNDAFLLAFRTHKDYVKALAYAKDREQVASAGLDKVRNKSFSFHRIKVPPETSYRYSSDHRFTQRTRYAIFKNISLCHLWNLIGAIFLPG
jgi:hypothetical protein